MTKQIEARRHETPKQVGKFRAHGTDVFLMAYKGRVVQVCVPPREEDE